MNEVSRVEFTGGRSQATHVEQSRAIAEVQAAVLVAQAAPRDEAASIRAMEESCSQQALAEVAFFAFPRGGKTVQGPSIHLARELARCWGNIQYGISELDRDDVSGRSEMQAWAWDLQANTRNSHSFIVPHTRDTREGAKPLTDMRDIYENNANQGSRRVREAIFATLPPWFQRRAIVLCRKTLGDGGGKPLAQRIADAIGRFSVIGVSIEQLEESVGRVAAEWTEADIVDLGVKFKSIDHGDATADELFPRSVVSVDEIVAARSVGPPPAPAQVSSPVAEPPSEDVPMMSETQKRRLFATLKEHDITTDRVRKTWASTELGREVESFKSLTQAEATQLIEVAAKGGTRE